MPRVQLCKRSKLLFSQHFSELFPLFLWEMCRKRRQSSVALSKYVNIGAMAISRLSLIYTTKLEKGNSQQGISVSIWLPSATTLYARQRNAFSLPLYGRLFPVLYGKGWGYFGNPRSRSRCVPWGSAKGIKKWCYHSSTSLWKVGLPTYSAVNIMFAKPFHSSFLFTTSFANLGRKD